MIYYVSKHPMHAWLRLCLFSTGFKDTQKLQEFMKVIFHTNSIENCYLFARYQSKVEANYSLYNLLLCKSTP